MSCQICEIASLDKDCECGFGYIICYNIVCIQMVKWVFKAYYWNECDY